MPSQGLPFKNYWIETKGKPFYGFSIIHSSNKKNIFMSWKLYKNIELEPFSMIHYLLVKFQFNIILSFENFGF